MDQDYESVVDLEPETMSAVVAAGGANPQQLTMVRKARGTESHKGGQIWTQGDDSDTCLTSWLAGSVDTSACASGMADVLPGGSSNSLLQCLAQPLSRPPQADLQTIADLLRSAGGSKRPRP